MMQNQLPIGNLQSAFLPKQGKFTNELDRSKNTNEERERAFVNNLRSGFGNGASSIDAGRGGWGNLN
jgi:hypothetical protein